MRNKPIKLLVAYDGSPGADVALDDLRYAGLPREAQTLIVSVADVFMPPQKALDDEDIPESASYAYAAHVTGVALHQNAIKRGLAAIQEAQELADKGRERLRALFPAWEVETFACADSPAWGILKKAGEWKPDLTVVGATRHSLTGTLLMGSIAEGIVTKSLGSVRIGRANDRASGAPMRLLVGLDGSPDAQAALSVIAARDWPAATEVCVFTILDSRMANEIASLLPALARWIDDGGRDGADEFAWVYRMANEAADQLCAAGLDATWTVQEGDSKYALLDEARRWDTDCIFVGAKGLVGSSILRQFERFFLGTTATVVAGRAPCSVEVVRAS